MSDISLQAPWPRKMSGIPSKPRPCNMQENTVGHLVPCCAHGRGVPASYHATCNYLHLAPGHPGMAADMAIHGKPQRTCSNQLSRRCSAQAPRPCTCSCPSPSPCTCPYPSMAKPIAMPKAPSPWAHASSKAQLPCQHPKSKPSRKINQSISCNCR